MKKTHIIIFACLFFAVCLFPGLTLGRSSDAGKQEEAEQEDFPKVTENGSLNTEFFAEFDTWVTRHMGFRSAFINVNARLRAALFGESAEDDVIIGSGGWLYYADTLDDYQNIATLSDRNVKNIAATLLMMQNYCGENGAAFVFTVAPNKNSVYGANMPSRYGKAASDNNLTRLTSALEDAGVSYANLLSVISASEEVLYQKRDSHWTYRGALLAYQTIIKQLGTEHSLMEDTTFTKRNDWDADLVNMLYTDEPDTDEQWYPDTEFTYETKGVVVSQEALTIEAFGSGEGKLLMFRDSFGNTSWPYFAENYGQSEFSRVVPYRLDKVKENGVTEVVLEIVERNLADLAERAPVMEAPEAELTEVFAADLSEYRETGYRKTEYGLLHVYGEIEESVLGESYEVIILANTADGIRRFKAFPIYEAELLGGSGDNGYSAYLPLTEEEITELSIVVISDGTTYTDNSVNWITVTD